VNPVVVGRTGLEPLDRLLSGHPRLTIEGLSDSGTLMFRQGDWHRRLLMDDAAGGLTETEDNNPLVCADFACVPGPAHTLALIALTPLVQADLVAAEPALLYSFVPEDLPDTFLGLDPAVAVQPVDLGSVLSLNAMVEVPHEVSPQDIGALFDEAYGRAFFVNPADEWDTRVVAGLPHAVFHLRLSPGEGTNLLTVQVMADRDGKCGAAQIVHKLNVMCGFEETLGIA